MSLRSALFYSVYCDYPGCTTNTADLSEYASWMQADYAVEEWNDSDGLTVEMPDGTERHYCHTHTMANDEEVDDPYLVPLPEGIEGEFILAERRIRAKIHSLAENALHEHLLRCQAWQLRDAVRARQSGITRTMTNVEIARVAAALSAP